MTPTQAEALIRERCIEANPSILDLTFGCEVEVADCPDGCCGETKFTVDSNFVYDQNNEMMYDKSWSKTNGFYVIKILGRPIRLSDILLAIGYADQNEGTKDNAIKQLVFGGSYYENREDLRREPTWNLTQDDLHLQSDSTKIFIANLLK